MTEKILPLRQLLKPDTPFQWTEHLQCLFDHSKTIIANEIEDGVRIFDPSKTTFLATDWSKTGIGFWLLHKHCPCPEEGPLCCNDGWKVTLIGSRFTHAADAWYAPNKGEALAVADALDKARCFVLGCDDLIVAVDHKPLLDLFGDRSLEDIPNNRLRNLKENTIRYRFRMVHIPGIRHRAADCISCYPTGEPEKLFLEDDVAALHTDKFELMNSPGLISKPRTPSVTLPSVEVHVIASASSTLDMLSLRSVTWERVRTATASDDDMQALVTIIEAYQFRDDLHTIDGVILYKDRIIIPPSLQEEVLASLHSAHQGVTSMISRAESSIFWPGITRLSVLHATAVTALHHQILALHQPLWQIQITHSNVFVQISSTTRAVTT